MGVRRGIDAPDFQAKRARQEFCFGLSPFNGKWQLREC